MKKKATPRILLKAALAQKAKARKYRAKPSFSEKIERTEALRERLRPFKEAREERRRKTGSTAIS
jgi:hypothetical protein